ncbi:MAG: nitroreductase family protein [Treponema sp.]|nr:nitroreductase family protein [Treponema sp.]
MIEIEKRRSIRKYQSRKIEEDKIEALIESARLAPSGNNTQPWQFILIDDSGIIKKVAETAHNQQWIRTAPLLIACVADIQVRLPDSGNMHLEEDTPCFELKQIIRDTAIAVEHIVLEAVHQGLGTCWVCWFTENEMRQILGIPEDKFLVTILAAGYPDENPAPRPRKKTEEIVHRNRW